jgi:hypothetical protein
VPAGVRSKLSVGAAQIFISTSLIGTPLFSISTTSLFVKVLAVAARLKSGRAHRQSRNERDFTNRLSALQ